jgi:hypothetical protein
MMVALEVELLMWKLSGKVIESSVYIEKSDLALSGQAL